jgi:hypothetical protein
VFLRGGKLKLTDNVYDFDDTKRGGVVDKLLIPLGRASRLLPLGGGQPRRAPGARGPREPVHAADIAALKTLATGTTSFDYTLQHAVHGTPATVTRDRTLIYRDARHLQRVQQEHRWTWPSSPASSTGIARHLWEHEFYVPFYRVADEDDGGVRGMNIKSGVVRQEAFKQLKGGKNALNADLLDNTLMNWAHLLDAAAKNRAAKATLEARSAWASRSSAPQYTAQQIGVGHRPARTASCGSWTAGREARHFVIDQTQGPPADGADGAGVRRHAQPGDERDGRLQARADRGRDGLAVLQGAQPDPRLVQAIGTGPLSYNVGKNIAQGWKLTSTKQRRYFRLLAGGGTIHFGTMLEGSEAKRVQALVESGRRRQHDPEQRPEGQGVLSQFIEPGITAYNELGNRGEAINRAALYEQLTKQGVEPRRGEPAWRATSWTSRCRAASPRSGSSRRWCRSSTPGAGPLQARARGEGGPGALRRRAGATALMSWRCWPRTRTTTTGKARGLGPQQLLVVQVRRAWPSASRSRSKSARSPRWPSAASSSRSTRK